VPLRVGRIAIGAETQEKEFFLYADETIIGSSPNCHFSLKDIKDSTGVSPQHLRIFRRKTGLWAEAVVKDADNTLVNRRKILGPVELLDGDTIEIGTAAIRFTLKDAC
jgi:predicted component of type VI protein secretion system